MLHHQIATFLLAYKRASHTHKKQWHALLLNSSLRKWETCFNSCLPLWHFKPTPPEKTPATRPQGKGQEKGPLFTIPI